MNVQNAPETGTMKVAYLLNKFLELRIIRICQPYIFLKQIHWQQSWADYLLLGTQKPRHQKSQSRLQSQPPNQCGKTMELE